MIGSNKSKNLQEGLKNNKFPFYNKLSTKMILLLLLDWFETDQKKESRKKSRMMIKKIHELKEVEIKDKYNHHRTKKKKIKVYKI
jgi:hypothetical protein